MANGTGTATSYSFGASGYEIDMEDMIQQLSPLDVPFQGGAGGGDPDLVLPTGGVTETAYNWQDELLLIPRSTLGAAVADAVVTTVTVAAGDKLKFQPGHILQIDAEWLIVSSYGSGDVLNVVRGVSGTAAAHSSGAAVVGVGTALGEGATPPTPKFNDRTPRQNFTQIFGPTAVAITGTDQAVRKYGVPNEFAKQAGNRMSEMAIDREQAIIYGARFNDTGNQRRAFGGILFFVQTNVDLTTTTLTEAAYLAHLQSLYDIGGTPELSVMGSKQKRLMSGFTSAGTVQVQLPSNQRGAVVEVFDSDFGTIRLKLHRWFKTPDLVTFRRDQAVNCTLRPLQLEPLGKTGDFSQSQLVAEWGFKFYRERHAGRFSALT